MGQNSAIEWTDHTFNPWWGCERISPGCLNCYADTWARRLGMNLWDGAPRRTFGAKHWADPIKWNRAAERSEKRPRVFCASMADVFDKDAPETERANLWDLIEDTPYLDWLLLTKRIGNVGRMLPEPPRNVWLGISVVNQEEADRDIPKLKQIPAAVRFLSLEPLLGPIELPNMLAGFPRHITRDGRAIGAPLTIHWVIVGGESGGHARPMHPEWARSLRDQCNAAGVAYLFKQWGEWRPVASVEDSWAVNPTRLHYERSHDVTYAREGKKAAGRTLDGRTWEEFPRSAA
jgi:protein gp37